MHFVPLAWRAELLQHDNYMAKPIIAIRKKRGRGRPPTGKALPSITLRIGRDKLAEVDRWAKQQPDNPDRSEALRRLVDRGLACGSEASPNGNQAKPKSGTGRIIRRLS
jgi:hypothetical protein